MSKKAECFFTPASRLIIFLAGTKFIFWFCQKRLGAMRLGLYINASPIAPLLRQAFRMLDTCLIVGFFKNKKGGYHSPAIPKGKGEKNESSPPIN